MYELIYSEEAVKQLKKLDRQPQKRIIATLERIRIRPYPHIKKLVGCPYFRLRAGDYRVILDIKQDKLLILVLEVGHRRNIYDKEFCVCRPPSDCASLNIQLETFSTIDA